MGAGVSALTMPMMRMVMGDEDCQRDDSDDGRSTMMLVMACYGCDSSSNDSSLEGLAAACQRRLVNTGQYDAAHLMFGLDC